MALNKDYVIPTKVSGASINIAPDGLYYGTLDYDWNFSIHAPVMTLDFASRQTGKNLAAGAGSTEIAEVELLKIAKISKAYKNNKIPLIARDILEYRIAHDTDLLNDELNFQLEILQTWGGYQSLYRVTDADNQKSIGKAAELFVNGTTLLVNRYNFYLDPALVRSGY